jgi:hypothetical protein
MELQHTGWRLAVPRVHQAGVQRSPLRMLTLSCLQHRPPRGARVGGGDRGSGGGSCCALLPRLHSWVLGQRAMRPAASRTPRVTVLG